MKTSDVLVGVAALIIVVSLLCIWLSPSVQDFMAANSLWNGVKDFSTEVNAASLDSLDELPESSQGRTLVAIPYIQPGDDDLSEMRNFVTEGGNLLLMDDYGYGNSVLEYLGVDARFTGETLLDPLFCYRNQWLPKITDFNPELEESGIKVLVLNHATSLTNVAESDVIAWSSSSSFLDLDEDESLRNEPQGPFPVAAKLKLGKGTVALVSDPSIMINSMVRKDDNYSFVQYLTGSTPQAEQLLIDRSHLQKDQRDESQTGLTNLRSVFSMPYPLLGLTAVVFIVVFRYTLKKGETIG
ncbi:MAG: hypothetical protein JW732_06115 [Dehalococcoidia bacterium]|nr:hypothetical protein [Dehalococcoidia bacterium]